MNLKHHIFSLAVGAGLLVPVAAFADGDRDDRREHHRREHHDREHRHDAHCGHHVTRPPAPPMSSQPEGRYELRTVQRWVDGHYVKEWVPEQCVYKGRRHRRVKCTSGYYTDRWVPGRYENVQEWVWVPYAHRPHVHWQVSARF